MRAQPPTELPASCATLGSGTYSLMKDSTCGGRGASSNGGEHALASALCAAPLARALFGARGAWLGRRGVRLADGDERARCA